ncbi:hypothetical protein GCM10011351_16390 [Paraliobacillus quinghaiensis]|uniref:Uncharacterized protein n=1 Tax=Paraliobacillus quinghaiensis TaxID=470815 RepID=A0A917TPJ2_9BACI|nr:YrhC family protein [Paraliobacillus quinghaiensis]GGM30997.1 hypothetical protein GCM10011351_16390 [Paraliobacillus quinghaiensis]
MENEELETKIIDYQRFLFMSLIMSCYLYAGIVIQAYVYQQTAHIEYISILTLICLAAAGWFQMLIINLNKKK